MLMTGLALASSAVAGLGPVPGKGLGTSHGLRYVVGTYGNVQPGGIPVETPCAEAHAAVGGGVDVTGSPKTSRFSSSLPEDDSGDVGFDPDDFWLAEVQNLVSQVKTIRVYAVCRKAGLDGLTYVFSPAHNVEPNSVENVSVHCPTGTRAVSGGVGHTSGTVTQSSPFDALADENKRPDDGWRIRAYNDDVVDSHMLGAVAVCLDAGQEKVRYRSNGINVGTGKARTFHANCPKRMSVIGGGLYIRGAPGSGFAHSSLPRDSAADRNSIPDDRWAVTVIGGASAKAYAICVR